MATVARSRFLDLRALEALAHMRFTTRHRIEGNFSGRHQSRQQGGAGEFVDFREYSGSEDLRRLDWKVYGRTGKAFVRLHQDETNLVSTLAIDASESMRFAGHRGDDKLQYAQYLATAFSQILLRGQDQVGVSVLRDRIVESVPPAGTPSHVQQVQEMIEQIQTGPSTKMAESLRNLFESSTRRGVLILLSDFLQEDLEDIFSALRLFRHRRWEVILIHLVHPDEEALPPGLAYRFVGMEDEGAAACSPTEIAAEYAQRFNSHLAMVRQLALAGGCDYRRVSTAVPYLQTLRGFLVDRAG